MNFWCGKSERERLKRVKNKELAMELINKTKKKLIAAKVIFREKKHETVLGLLLHKTRNYYIYDYLKWNEFSRNDAMLFKVRGKSGVHTWFMSFPISVFFLKDMKVIEKVKLMPFEIYKPKGSYECFVELDGSILNEINIGDKLEFR